MEHAESYDLTKICEAAHGDSSCPRESASSASTMGAHCRHHQVENEGKRAGSGTLSSGRPRSGRLGGCCFPAAQTALWLGDCAASPLDHRPRGDPSLLPSQGQSGKRPSRSSKHRLVAESSPQIQKILQGRRNCLGVSHQQSGQ